jgi:hypothetical protein
MRAHESGQASAELAALLPVVAAVLGIAWQVVVGGHATAAAATAARAAARADAVGADPREAARRHLPARLERGLRVHRTASGAVTVSVRVPAVAGGISLGSVKATARLPAG